MKPKSLCFTGEASCLVYPDFRYCCLLRPALVTGKLNYLPTVERRKKKEQDRTGKGEVIILMQRDSEVVFLGAYEEGKINDPWTLDKDVETETNGSLLQKIGPYTNFA